MRGRGGDEAGECMEVGALGGHRAQGLAGTVETDFGSESVGAVAGVCAEE